MPNNEKNAEPAVRDAQSTAARRRRRRHTPHGDAPAQNPTNLDLCVLSGPATTDHIQPRDRTIQNFVDRL